MRRHFSAETLAMHREGVVSAGKAASIESHLSGCSRCSGVNSDLAAVSATLGETQLQPMPDALVARLQMAIASESAQRIAANPGLAARGPATDGVVTAAAAFAAGAAAGAGVDAAPDAAEGGASDEARPAHIPGRPDLPERRGRGARRFRMPSLSSPLLLRGLAAASAVVIIAGAGYLLASGQTASETSAGNGAASAPAVRSQPTASGRAVNRPTYLNYRLNGKITPATLIASHANFTKATLAAQVRRDVSSSPALATGLSTPQASQAGPTKATFGGRSIFGLAGCLNRIAAGRQVLLADIALYLGKPATVIVLRPLTAANVFDVAIVGLACSASNADVISRTTVPTR